MASSENSLSPEQLAEEMRLGVWYRIEPPLWWDEIQDHIVADGVIGEFRGHMVAGHVEHGRIVHGAYIVGQADWPDAHYSAELSHLSEKVSK